MTIKELSKEFEEEFNCPEKNTEKYKTFSVPIRKKVKKTDKNREEIISSQLQFTDCARFLVSLLSNLVDNLAEGIHKIKCKYGHHKKWETGEIKYTDCECFREYRNIKDDLIEYKY